MSTEKCQELTEHIHRRYFYGRVSSKDQNLARQLESARKYKNIDAVFKDKQSGKDFNRDDYQRMKEILEPGDEVVVHSLDRLGRNKEMIKEELAWFKEHGIVVRILDVPTTLIEYPAGQEWVMDMVNNILIEVLGAFAEQERENIRKRQKEGIAAMPVDENGRKISTKPGKEGRVYGRREKRPENFTEVYERQQRGEIKLAEALKMVGVGRTRWYELAREA
jgi:DNA invertase Pin-like site-specific DNA recombinase